MTTVKSDAALLRVAGEGAQWLHTPSAPDVKQALPYAATSRWADAWLIGAWCVYHTGRLPRALRASRGHRYAADIQGLGEVLLTITDPHDHRDGVRQVA